VPKQHQSRIVVLIVVRFLRLLFFLVVATTAHNQTGRAQMGRITAFHALQFRKMLGPHVLALVSMLELLPHTGGGFFGAARGRIRFILGHGGRIGIAFRSTGSIECRVCCNDGNL
jgi:hypothetical protein